MSLLHNFVAQKNAAIKYVLSSFLAIVLFSLQSSAQLSITSTSTFSQNFDGIGSTATASVPTGWALGASTAGSYTAAATATTQAAGTTGTGIITGTQTGGLYNFANGITGSSTDRALGFITTGSFAGPCYLHLRITNNTGSTISALDLSFDYEKYRSGSNAAGWSWIFTTGTDGVSYGSAISAGGQSYAADANNTTISNPPTSTTKTVSITGLSIANGASYYLRWQYLPTTGTTYTNAQALGVDNFSVTATLACSNPTAQSVTGGGSYCSGGSGVSIGLGSSQSGVNYQLYNGASTVGSPVAGTGAAISFGSTFTSAGTYTVLASTATGTCTATMSGSAVVSINALPTAQTVTGTGSYCSGGSGVAVGLASSVSGVNYQLYRGASAIGSPVAGTGAAIGFGNQTTAGTYTVTGTNTTTSCVNSMTGSAVVSINPLPTPTISGTTTISSGGSAVLTFAGINGDVVYYWNGGSTVSTTISGAGTSTVSVSPTVTTTYSVTSATSAAGCSQSITGQTATVTVSTTPVAFISGAASICPGSTAVLTFTGTAGGTVYYNDGITSGLNVTLSGSSGTGTATATVSPTVTSTYSLESIVSGGTYTLSGSVVVTVNSTPSVFSVTGTGAYCSGGSGRAVGLSGSQSGVNYQLYNGASAVGSPVAGTGSAISFGSFTTATTYTVVGTNTATCTSNMSGSAVISINPLPTAFSVTGTGSYCSGGAGVAVGLSNSASGINYQLYNGASTVGSPVAGTGAAISFGNQTTAATYTVLATNATTSCTNAMTGSAVVTITALANAGSISGTTTVAFGATTALTASGDAGGTWTSSNTSIATVGTSGTVTGISGGTSTISYTVTNVCNTSRATVNVTVTGPTAVTMSCQSGLSYAEAFTDIASWSASASGFSGGTGSSRWWPVAVGGSAAIPDPTKMTVASSAFTTLTSGGLQKGTNNLVFLSTGTTDNSNAVAVDFFMDFTGVNAGTLSFNAAQVSNTTGDRGSTLKVYYSTNGSTFTELTGTNLPFAVFNNVANSASISVALPSAFNNSPSARLRFYEYNATVGTTGSRAKISIDDVTVTATSATSPITGTMSVCVGNTTTLASSTSGGTWSSSNAAVGTIGTSGVVTGITAGTTTISYAVMNASGCVTYVTTVVTVNPLPSSTGTTNNGPICVGGTVTLSANSSVANAWSWTGPSGFTSSLQNPTATPTTTGTYSLTLSNSTTGCSTATVYTTSVTVNPVPSSTGATNSSPICIGGTVNLSANSSNATSWSWSGPGGFSSSTQNPTATPTVTGTYSLTVSSTGNGCSPATVYTTSVTVNPVPSSTGATNSSPICIGGTVNLAANSSNATSWSWNGPSGFSSSAQNPSATPTVTGTYSLTVSSTGNGCSPATVYTTSVTVNPVPSSTGATNSSPICIGGTVNLSANSSNATSWSWNGPSGFSSSAQNPSATPTVTGTYSLTVSSTGNGCSPATVYTTSVTVNPVPSSTGATNSSPICIGGTVNLSANSSNATSWSWNGPSGFSSSAQNPSATPTVTGTYSLTVSSTGNGCSPATVYTTSVTVNPVPSSTGATNDGPICVGGTVNLSANSTDATSWSWNGPSGFSSSTQNPSATPAVTGTYSLTVSSTGNGCSPSTVYTTSVTVNPVPSSTGATNDGPICVGGTVNLSANSSNATSWSWSGPSGFSSSAQNPSATPMVTGTYSLTVSSTGNGCSPATVYTTSVTVNPVPSSTGATNDGPICVGGTVNLAGNSSDATSWSWSGPSGFSSSAQNPSATPTVTGTYSLTVSSTGNGCSPATVYTTSVTVNPVPSSTGATNDGPICVGGTVNLAANSSNATSWSWSGPSGFSSSAQNPSATPTVTGTYSLTVSSTGNGCSPSTVYTTSVTVNPVPSSTGATNDGPICVGGTVNLAANSSDATSWSWNGPSGFSSSAQNPSATPTVTGTYSLTVSSTGNGCSPATVYTTSVTVNPVPSSTGATNDGPICVGGTVNLAANSSDATSWSWSGPSGFSSSTQNPSATPTVTGTYSLTVSSTGNGCSPATVYTTSVTVNPVPSSTGATNDGPICVGGTVNLSANSSNATSWSWNGPSGFSSSAQNPSATPTVTGTYSLTVSSTGNGCSPSTVYTTSVTVNPVPSSTGATNDGPICVGGTVNLSANSTDATSWSWNGPSGFSSSAQNPSATPTVTGTYSLTVSSTGNGCSPATVYTTSVTVNPVPSSTGTTNDGPICVGGTVNLSANSTDATSWSWSGPSGFSSSTQNPSATPTVTGTYSLTVSSTGNGCSPATVYTTSVTVNPVPSSTGATNDGLICVGGTVNLSANSSDATSWSWSGPSGFSTSAQNPSATPTVTGTYSLTVSSTGNGCSPATVYTTSVTVNPVPSSTGATNDGPICVGGTVNLSANSSDATSWSWSGPSGFSSSAQNPTVTPTTTGTYSLTLSSTGNGCNPATVYTTTITVNPVPSSISGTSAICVGATTTLTNTVSGGSWSSSNPSVATVGSSSGDVTGIASGNATITYTLPEGCYRIFAMTINPMPSAITGTLNTCVGSTTTLADVTVGGTWTSSNTSVVTIGSTSGVAYGVSTGTSGITYTLVATGCSASTVVSINAAPAAITGVSAVCIGGTVTLTNTVTGGTWTGSNASIGTVGSSTGIVTGAATGNFIVSYATGTSASCKVGATITVNPLPSVITGTLVVCSGSTITLSNGSTGGTWSSSNTSVATVGTGAGVVTGVSAGTSIITYMLSTGCYRTSSPVTVNLAPAAISGSSSICVGTTMTFTNSVSGGTWTSSNTSVATVGSSTGLVTGAIAGASTISYNMPTGCRTTLPITVNALPATIMGTASICLGATSTLTNTTLGGSWSSSNSSVATIGSSTGIISSLAVGTSTITYSLATGCYRTITISVNDMPAAIGGNSPICLGYTDTLTNTTPGGTWTSSSSSASVGSASGIVTAVTVGTVNISYTIAGGCRAITTVTINANPVAIGGATAFCANATTTLTDASVGGSWTSSNAAAATIGSSTGVVTGVDAGVTTITYTLTTGCYITKPLTVNAMSTTTGSNNVCLGATIALTNSTSGGTWSSGTATIATVGSSTGIVTGVAAGAANISYSIAATGCRSILNVTVNPIQPITGNNTACMGSTTTFADATVGGTWSSNNLSVATVGTSGIVSGVSVGTATISYIMPTGCFSTRVVSINPTPTAILGTLTVCAGSTTSLSDAVTGGTWSSSSVTVCTVGSTSGIVTGVAAGAANITYTMGVGCYVTTVVTVSPILPITGTAAACIGMTTTLASASAGGTWSTSNASIATVGSLTGVVTGVGAGVANITYLIPSGCYRVQAVTVNPAASSLTGTTTVCAGFTTTFTPDVVGGTWNSSNTTIATVGTSGIVTGVGAGVATISYNVGFNCRVTRAVTVSTSPAITGTAKACIGLTTTLSNTATGGVWSTDNAAIATINASTGVVTGVAAGTVVISYAPPSGCPKTIVVTINPLPNAITGNTLVCIGGTTTLSNTTAGGVSWTSSNTAVATVGASSGIATPVSSGTATITYLVNTGCYATTVLSVNPAPSPITGTTTVCVGSTTALSHTDAGGTWASTTAGVASIGTTGILTGVTAGTSIVTYTLSTGCRVTTTATVNPIAAIAGTLSVCEGNTTTLTNATSGGTWSSTNTAIGTIGTSTGIVTGLLAGTTAISYTTAAGCMAGKVVTVVTAPATITGASSVCVSSSITLTNSVTGGAWSGSNPAIATVGGGTGVINGMASGTVNVTYTLGTCKVFSVVSVNAVPAAVTGSSSVCVGSTITLSDVTASGTWVSGNATNAGVDNSTGVVSGLVAGTSIISYVLSTGCYKSLLVTVNPLPAAITGTLSACPGTTTVLSDATTGGTSWNSSNTSVATIGVTSGTVSGLTVGTTNITYTLSTGCYVTAMVTINPLPATIAGPTAVCPGATITLTNTDAGGTWSSTSLPVGSASGIVTGIGGGGSGVVTYTLPTGCRATKTVTLNVSAAPIGNQLICVGSTNTLTNSVSGGTWSSSNTGVATVGSLTGQVVGISAGSADITYMTGLGCVTYLTEYVSASPSGGAILGASTVIIGDTIMLTDSIPTGTWTSSNAGVATVTSTTGIVTGVSAGAVVISYTINNGCGAVVATYNVTVTSSRPGSPIKGGNSGVVNLNIYPNPTSGVFTLTSDSEGVLRVYSLDGKEAAIYEVSQGKTILNVPNGFAAGVYMCRFTNITGNTIIVSLVYQP